MSGTETAGEPVNEWSIFMDNINLLIYNAIIPIVVVIVA